MANGKRRLDNWISGFLEYTKEFEPPDSFLLWTAISTIGAALQRKVRLEWGADVYYPNFYIVLVAPPGRARKGTAMKPARDILRELKIPLSADRTTLAALVQDLSSASDSYIDRSKGVSIAHSSLTIFSPEFSVFCGKDNMDLLMNLADWFDCDSLWENKTKTQGVEEIHGVFVNLIGATTPHLVQKNFNEMIVGGGLASRIIFICEQNRRFASPSPFFVLSEEGRKLKQDLVHDLAVIRNLAGPVKITEEFLKKYHDWYINQPEECPFDPYHFGSYWSRRSVHLRKLAMVIVAARQNNLTLTGVDFDAALTLLEQAEDKMPDVFAGVGASSDSELIHRVAQFIYRKKEVTFGEIMREFLMDTNLEQLRHILNGIKEAGFCTINGPRNAHQKITWNPDYRKDGKECKS